MPATRIIPLMIVVHASECQPGVLRTQQWQPLATEQMSAPPIVCIPALLCPLWTNSQVATAPTQPVWLPTLMQSGRLRLASRPSNLRRVPQRPASPALPAK
eukprot:3938542-Rhodomonas_salina.2